MEAIELRLKRHEECRQYFIDATTAARQHLAVGQLQQARYELLRANASVAQGMIWAETCSITDVGWIDRMNEVEGLWELANK